MHGYFGELLLAATTTPTAVAKVLHLHRMKNTASITGNNDYSYNDYYESIATNIALTATCRSSFLDICKGWYSRVKADINVVVPYGVAHFHMSIQ